MTDIPGSVVSLPANSAAVAHAPLSRRPVWAVEDSDEDYHALTRALSDISELEGVLQRFRSGDACLDLLEELAASDEHSAERGKLPALILLDLNLPGTDGREVLQFIKSSSELKRIPVAILTTSANPRDIEACYKTGANSYLIKSLDFAKFRHNVQLIVRYWLEAAALP